MIVELSNAELAHAARAGLERRLISLRRQDLFASRDPWGNDIEGAVAEYAVSVALNMSWRPIFDSPTDAPCDVGTHVQVRSSNNGTHGLWVRRNDNDRHTYVLARTHDLLHGRVDVVGWVHGREAKRPEYWQANAPFPAYCVPVSALRPITEALA